MGVGDLPRVPRLRSTRRSSRIDVGTQVPHGAVRGYVMGERGARNEPATPDDIAADGARSCARAIEAGALGVSTSRTIAHRAIDGEPVPGHVRRRGRAVRAWVARSRDAGAGVFELAPAGVMGEDLAASEKEMDWMRRLSRETGRPVTFALLQHDFDPDQWKKMLDLATEAYDEGVPIRPQIAGRPLGLLLGLQTFHPLSRPAELRSRSTRCRSTRRWRRCATPTCGRASSPRCPDEDDRMAFIGLGLDRIFKLGEPPDYEPAPDESIAALAERAGRDPVGLPLRPAARATTGASCCCARCSATATSPRTRSAR